MFCDGDGVDSCQPLLEGQELGAGRRRRRGLPAGDGVLETGDHVLELLGYVVEARCCDGELVRGAGCVRGRKGKFIIVVVAAGFISMRLRGMYAAGGRLW